MLRWFAKLFIYINEMFLKYYYVLYKNVRKNIINFKHGVIQMLQKIKMKFQFLKASMLQVKLNINNFEILLNLKE